MPCIISDNCTVTRTSWLFNGAIREAITDTVLFGHAIPKNTQLFIMDNGPGYVSPPLPVDDGLRSESSRNAKTSVGEWKGDAADMRAFKPERWLVQNLETGKDEFDSQAGPNLAFGLGARGCYGRRLAYLQLRIVLVMLLWNFELLETPPDLSGPEATTRMLRCPRQCYVRLEKVRL
jgi:hypothetical protein